MIIETIPENAGRGCYEGTMVTGKGLPGGKHHRLE